MPNVIEDENVDGGIVVNAASAYAKEMAKWEQFPSKFTGSKGPGNPYQYRPFPKMLYQAKHRGAKVVCMAEPPHPMAFPNASEHARAEQEADAFNQSCQRIVNNEAEMAKAFESGWRESIEDAVAFVKERDRSISTAAAERNYQDRNMSDAAKREIAEAEAAADGQHLPEVPVKRRGRPRKVHPAA